MLSFILRFLFTYLSGKRKNVLILWFTEGLSLFVTLYVFSISNQFVADEVVSGEAKNYFQFLLLGEIALILPISLFENMIRNYQEFLHCQFLETLNGIHVPFRPVLLKKSLYELVPPIIRVILMFVLSHVFFGFSPAFASCLLFIFIQILSVMGMYLVALLVIQVHLTYKRGLKIIYLLNSLLAVFGGAYFPIKFLPNMIGQYLVWLFPQSFILQVNRLAFSEHLDKSLKVTTFFILYIIALNLIVRTIGKILKRKNLLRAFSHVEFTNFGQSM